MSSNFKNFSEQFTEEDWEIYRNLSENKKKELKNSIDLATMLMESLNKIEYLTNFQDSALEDYLERAKKAGFKKPFGAKANAYFKNTQFVTKLDSKSYMIYETPEFKRGNVAVKYSLITEFSTPRGLHYVFTDPMGDETIMSSHFFDRMLERLNLKGSRTLAIKKLFRFLSGTNFTNRKANEESGLLTRINLELYTEEGLVLGSSFSFGTSGGRSVLVDYLQTFISLDMMRRDQLERHAEAYISGLNP